MCSCVLVSVCVLAGYALVLVSGWARGLYPRVSFARGPRDLLKCRCLYDRSAWNHFRATSPMKTHKLTFNMKLQKNPNSRISLKCCFYAVIIGAIDYLTRSPFEAWTFLAHPCCRNEFLFVASYQRFTKWQNELDSVYHFNMFPVPLLKA